jgi:hypothetical protein
MTGRANALKGRLPKARLSGLLRCGGRGKGAEEHESQGKPHYQKLSSPQLCSANRLKHLFSQKGRRGGGPGGRDVK